MSYISDTRGIITASKLKDFILCEKLYKVKRLNEVCISEEVPERAMLWDAFHYLVEVGYDKRSERYQVTEKFLKADLIDLISNREISEESKEAKRKEELNKQLVSALKSGLDAIAGVSSNITEQQIQDNDKKTDKEIKNLDRELSQKLITQEEHDRKVAELEKAKDEKQRQLKKKQFETDRQIAIVKIIIATAEAVITQFAETGYYGAILAGVVGAAELAVVASQPTPQFEKGGKVKGKRHHSGGTLIEAEKDEWIINRTEAMKNDKMLKAINDGQGDKYIFDHYIAPALKQQQKKLSESKDKSFANNLAMSMGLNFKDSNLLDSLKQSRKNDREIALFLAKELKPNTRDARRF